MARQSMTPVDFNHTRRTDNAVLMTSGYAGKVVPVAYAPLLRGDSASGTVGVDIELAEMPRPLLNGVLANVQAWFVPKSAHRQFTGLDEFRHSFQKGNIQQLGAADRTPPAFFLNTGANTGLVDTVASSELAKTLGLHFNNFTPINFDLIDAYNLVYNFRLGAHSSKLARRQYATESLSASTTLARAFWPSGRFSRVVPDYERALILGGVDVDVLAATLPITGNGTVRMKPGATTKQTFRNTSNGAVEAATAQGSPQVATGLQVGASGTMRHDFDDTANTREIYLDPNGTLEIDVASFQVAMAGAGAQLTLADIDKARTSQAFAKLRSAYHGNEVPGFINDDVIIAELMQGFQVPDEAMSQPWLLDSKRVAFGMVERHATDAANLDQSVSQGRASATLSLNVPRTESGGLIIVTVEVLPERLDERQSDEFILITDPDKLPNALRDVQRAEPVDLVLNRRLDMKHTTPNQLYGYEPMNDVWNRSFTRLGGVFYKGAPTAPWTENRANIWLPEIINPTYTGEHFLAPADFPQDVFSDPEAPAFELVARHNLTIVGLTQFGDVLQENTDDYAEVIAERP